MGQILQCNYLELCKEYEPDTSIWATDTKEDKLKEIVFNDLDEIKRRIIILYADIGSYTDLAKILHCSIANAWQVVKKIREEIIEIYNDKYNI